jgi:hypothetical protein
MVKIKVNRIWKIGWKGIKERIEYEKGNGREDLLKDEEMEICDVKWNVKSVEKKMNLEKYKIGKGCDREKY